MSWLKTLKQILKRKTKVRRMYIVWFHYDYDTEKKHKSQGYDHGISSYLLPSMDKVIQLINEELQNIGQPLIDDELMTWWKNATKDDFAAVSGYSSKFYGWSMVEIVEDFSVVYNQRHCGASIVLQKCQFPEKSKRFTKCNFESNNVTAIPF